MSAVSPQKVNGILSPRDPCEEWYTIKKNIQIIVLTMGRLVNLSWEDTVILFQQQSTFKKLANSNVVCAASLLLL